MTIEKGAYVMKKPRDKIIKHLRPGKSIFVQDLLPSHPLTTSNLENSPMTLLVNLDESFASQGYILNGNVTTKVSISKSSIYHLTRTAPNLYLSNITIFGH